jgi:hypothetical protein
VFAVGVVVRLIVKALRRRGEPGDRREDAPSA